MEQKDPIQNSGNSALRPLILSLVLSTGLWLGLRMHVTEKDKFSQIFDIIRKDYVDSTRIDQLEENTIDYLLSQLDPHSTYIPAQLKEYNERQIRGNYQGLGIEYIWFGDTIFVFGVSLDGPAYKAGVKAGDRLLSAGNIKFNDSMSSNEIQEAISGSGSRKVTLGIYRRSENRTMKISIEHGQINLNSTEVFYMVNKSLGYIKLERFSSNTHKEFMQALEALKSSGMTDLILDLRNNGGGLLSEAVAIANEFLNEDQIISYTYGFHRNKNYYRADGKGRFMDGRLILLINHNTASASEILAGAMQDNDRAVIMGNRSFGKGLVQEPFRISDGSVVRLTIARYYTPSGRSIQKSYDKDLAEYRNEIYQRDFTKDTINPVFDSTVLKEYFSRNGRLLVAGGGIRPEVILRDTINDSTEIEMLMPGLFYSRIFDIYVLDYLFDFLHSAKGRYKNITEFRETFFISNQEVTRFISKASRISYLRNLKYSVKSSDIIKKHLKAAIAFRLFGETGYSMIINLEEGIFSKSSEVLQKYKKILSRESKKSHSFDY